MLMPQTRPRGPLSLSHPNAVPLLIIAVLCMVANGPVLLHVVVTDPVQLFANLSPGRSQQLLPGSPTIDPNSGYVTLALGHRAALTWSSGHIPWWNPFEALGSPLAGEMQAGAFFPLVFLMGGWLGFAIFHVVLEIVAGWSTFFLLRTLGLGSAAATTGGAAFALCGTFAWLSNAVSNPVAFLPLCLLGIERCLSASTHGRRGGWHLLAIGVLLSIVAGFPETAYIDGLFMLVWASIRLFGARESRLRLARKVGTGVFCGALVSAPLLIAFTDYLSHSYLGGLSGALGAQSLPPQGLAQTIVPYGYGPIFAFGSKNGTDLVTLLWSNMGGYVGSSLLVLGLVGAVGKRLRPLRIGIALWTALAAAKTFGLPFVAGFVTHFPGLDHVATFRYAAPSWEMSIVVLAAMGIDDLRRRAVSAPALCGAGVVTEGLVAWALVSAWNVDGALSRANEARSYALGNSLWAFTTVALVVIGALVYSRRSPAHSRGHGRGRIVGIRLVHAVVALDVFVLFCMPFLSAPRPATVDLGPVRFLQSHLGLQRFATLGPLAPNFGSYFGIAGLNMNDVPVPSSFANHITSDLDSNSPQDIFNGTSRSSPNGPAPADELTAHLNAYEADGVKYVLVWASGNDVTGTPWPPQNLRPAPHLVYRDSFVFIYELPAPAPLFSPASTQCLATASSWTEATVHCISESTVTYRELPMEGWQATIDGRPATITPFGVYQVVAVPAGTSDVSFAFVPPFELLGLLCFVAGVLIFVAPLIWFRHSRSSTTSPRTSDGRLP